jgi:hypothetical protein
MFGRILFMKGIECYLEENTYYMFMYNINDMKKMLYCYNFIQRKEGNYFKMNKKKIDILKNFFK